VRDSGIPDIEGADDVLPQRKREGGGRSSSAGADRDEGAPETVLGVLRAVEQDSSVTQRSLAGQLGIALGLANIYLRRCVKKGLVKVQQVPARRYVYYLTPQGFAEKSRLTAEFLSSSFGFFRKTRDQLAAIYLDCLRAGHTRLVLAGGSELAEVAAIAAMESDVTLLAILDPSATTNRIAGVPVVRSLDAVGSFDAVIVTDIREPQRIYDGLVSQLPGTRIYAPAVLGVTRKEADRD